MSELITPHLSCSGTLQDEVRPPTSKYTESGSAMLLWGTIGLKLDPTILNYHLF